jgi:hypothetical protein
MSKELNKNLQLKYEELSDVELATLSGGAKEPATNNPFDENYGTEKKGTPPPQEVIKRKTTGSGR